jgi:hypothetical protein
MKKITIILIILLIFPLISSVEFEMKEEFDQGETLLAVISGNFLDQIVRDNIFFYREHVRIPVVYEVGKINDDFYIYAMLTGKEQGNYSVKIKEVRYNRGVEIVDEDIVKNFTITENTTDFSLNPGFIITSEDFFLEVQNLQEERITVQIDAPEAFISENSLELRSGEIKRISFKLNEEVLNLGSAFEEIKLSSENADYSVPVFVMSSINITEEEKRLNFKFEPHIVDVSIATDSDSKRIVYILNTGDTVEDIFISVSPLLEPYVTVSPQEINTLEKNSTEKIEIFITSGTEEIIIEGQIFARTENFTSSLILILDFIKDFIPEETEGEEVIITTCAQLGGIICEEGERCTGQTNPTKDGICCFAPAICEEIPKSQTGKIIGWGVIILVILFLFWFFKKYKKVKPKVDLLKISRGKR